MMLSNVRCADPCPQENSALFLAYIGTLISGVFFWLAHVRSRPPRPCKPLPAALDELSES